MFVLVLTTRCFTNNLVAAFKMNEIFELFFNEVNGVPSYVLFTEFSFSYESNELIIDIH